MNSKLGEFEEIVLMLVAAQHEQAYGLSVTKAIEKELDRSVTMSSVHTALYRLEEKGFVTSKIGDAEGNRRGRRKRVFIITSQGKSVLKETREARNHIWSMIPKFIFEIGQ